MNEVGAGNISPHDERVLFMSLRLKFGVLLVLLSAVVLATLGAAGWSVAILEKSFAEPLAYIQEVLGELRTLQRVALDERVLLEGQGAEDAQKRFTELATLGASLIEDFESNRSRYVRIGQGTTRNLHERLNRANELGSRWLSAQSVADRDEAIELLGSVSTLISEMQDRAIDDVHVAIVHGQTIRKRIQLLLLTSVAIVILVGLLGFALIRRWVMQPVAELRIAAGRIGMGEFSHRIPVKGHDEIASLSREVNHMAETVALLQEQRVEQERLAAIGELVRRVAHNVRNPLAGIRSLAELTRNELDSETEVHEHQSRIIQTVDRFDAWLGDLLSASRPVEIVPTRTEVRSWLEQVRLGVTSLAGAKNVEIVLKTESGPERARFDPRHMEQAVVAILTNAVQVSPAGSPVVIETRTGAGNWMILIQDAGPGVPEEIKEDIFKPYFTTRRDGTGIGLAVARRVIEQHGGSIEVRSGDAGAHNTGTMFVVRLPLDTAGKIQDNNVSGVINVQNTHH